MLRTILVSLILAGLITDVNAQAAAVAAPPDPGIRVLTIDRAKVDEIRVFARSESIDIVAHENRRRWFKPLANLLLVGDGAKLDALSQKLGAAVHHEEKVGDLILKVQWVGHASNGGTRWLSASFGKDTETPAPTARILELAREINVSGLRAFIVRHASLPWWQQAASRLSWSLSLPFEEEPFFTSSEQ